MGEICPVCNGLYEKQIICSRCQAVMVQSGRLEDYKGPYSPYVGKDTFVLNNTIALTGDNCCIHLYICPVCSHLEHGTVSLISI